MRHVVVVVGLVSESHSLLLRHVKNLLNKFVIMPFWRSVLMTELTNKIANKHKTYAIMMYLIWNEYVRKNKFWIEEQTERASKGMCTIQKIRNIYFYENFYSRNCRMLSIFNQLFGYFIRKELIFFTYSWNHKLW